MRQGSSIRRTIASIGDQRNAGNSRRKSENPTKKGTKSELDHLKITKMTSPSQTKKNGSHVELTALTSNVKVFLANGNVETRH